MKVHTKEEIEGIRKVCRVGGFHLIEVTADRSCRGKFWMPRQLISDRGSPQTNWIEYVTRSVSREILILLR